MSSHPTVANATSSQLIDSVSAGEHLIMQLGDVMNALLALIEHETELVRAGRLSEVARLEPSKGELARLYMANAALVKTHSAFLGLKLPTMVEALRRRHDTFEALLQINLTVLATAHAVSEGIIRGAAGELARNTAPKTYGMSGRPNAPRVDQMQPVALSRTS
jgi:hypothetical protein